MRHQRCICTIDYWTGWILHGISEPSQLHEHINMQLESIEKKAAGFMALLVRFVENPISKSPVDTILDEFLEYSTDYKKISKTMAKAECRLDRKYLQNPSLITANEIRDYVTNDLPGLKCSSAGRYITSLRNFFRFLEYKGVAISKSVFNLPLSPADWKNGRSSVCSDTIVFSCEIVSFSSLSGIFFALEAIVSLLEFHILIISKMGLLSRKNAT